MKQAWYLILPALVVLAAVMPGCSWWQEDIEIKPAPIHEVQVNIAESFPEQIFIYIKGGLADSCTTLHSVETERCENTINIVVTTERPRNLACAQIYGFFEENVALGSDFVSGETYIVDVNGVIRSFQYP